MLHVASRALDLNVGGGLKLALRALGSPRLVYQNIVRATPPPPPPPPPTPSSAAAT